MYKFKYVFSNLIIKLNKKLINYVFLIPVKIYRYLLIKTIREKNRKLVFFSSKVFILFVLILRNSCDQIYFIRKRKNEFIEKLTIFFFFKKRGYLKKRILYITLILFIL